MDFSHFLNQAWNDHATKPLQVAAQISNGFNLIDQADQIPQMAQLVTHIFGEHLGQWDNGIKTLQKLKQIPLSDSDGENGQAIARSIASLELASGIRKSVDDLSTSDQIRVLTTAASALCEQKRTEAAYSFLRQALEKAQEGLSKDDPANRALAVTGNNLACILEERPGRSGSETDLMILAAQTARQFWEIAGTWLHVERAEYRLSRSYLKAGDCARSLEHAQLCLEIVEKNNAPALEWFFGFEALALAEKARGNQAGYEKAVEQMKLKFENMSNEDKQWCEKTLISIALKA